MYYRSNCIQAPVEWGQIPYSDILFQKTNFFIVDMILKLFGKRCSIQIWLHPFYDASKLKNKKKSLFLFFIYMHYSESDVLLDIYVYCYFLFFFVSLVISLESCRYTILGVLKVMMPARNEWYDFSKKQKLISIKCSIYVGLLPYKTLWL